MPRLSKIRIVGNKYDNFKKCYDNTVFDLTRDNDPDHTLITMQNQSGKGVLMQLMSQIVLPNTKWGKNDGNKITGMFLNANKQFSPYTFHVILEWKLDTVPDKWLITGMCVTASKRSSMKEEEKEEKIGIRYFLYTHEHYASDFYTIENLPAYLKEEKKAVPYMEFEDFILKNKRDFRKFSESSAKNTRSEYYQYLEGNGIYRSEWSILKLINKVEGGASDYFSKAKDNKGIFDEYIIPSISENLNNQYEENKDTLKDIFKSNISITKNLPILINREADYKNLLTMLSPLIRDAEAGISYGLRKENSIITGNDLYCTLMSFQNNITIEKEKWVGEKGKTVDRKRELHFEKENLEYAKQNRVKIEYELEKLEQEKGLDIVKIEIDDLAKDKKKYEINKTNIPREIDISKRHKKLEEKKRLMSSLNLKDIEQEIMKIDEEIKEKWKVTQASLTETSRKHWAYESFLKAKEEEFKSDIRILKENQSSIRVNLGVFDEAKGKFNKREKELGLEFDAFRMVCPEILMEDVKKEYVEEDKKLLDSKNKISKFEKHINNLNIEKNKIGIQIDNNKEKKEELDKSYSEQKLREEELFLEILDMCRLENIEETYSVGFLQNKVFEIRKTKEIKRVKLNELKKELWENNIDLTLNNKDYWIPNNDIDIIKTKIESLSVKVVYGTQFLASLSEEEQKENLRNCPMLPYSLVIRANKDWDTISKNLSEDLFLRSIVPIYLRTKMEGQAAGGNFKLIRHKGLKFIGNNDAFQQWKESLSKKELEIMEAVKSIESSIDKIDKLINKIENMLVVDSAILLEQRIKDVVIKLDELAIELNTIGSKINDLQEKLTFYNNVKVESEKGIKSLEISIKKLEEFINFKNEIEIKGKQAAKDQEKLITVELTLTAVEMEKAENEDKKYLEQSSYEKWKIYVNNKLKDVKEIIEEASFKEEDNEQVQTSIQPNYINLEADDIFIDIEHRKNLSLKIEEKNYQINALSEAIDQLEENIEARLAELKKLDLSWANYIVENLYLDTIELELDSIAKKSEFKNATLIELTSSIGTKKGLIIQINNDIMRSAQKINEEHHKTPQLWENLNLEEKGIRLKDNIRGNDKYLKEVEDIIEKLDSRDVEMGRLVSEIKHFEELDSTKGKTSQYQMDKINNNEKNEVDLWIQNYKGINEVINNHTIKAQDNFDQFLEELKRNLKDEILKRKIKEVIGEKINIASFTNNKDSFSSMREHAQKEISRVSNDKFKAEEAKEQWASRAARQSIKIAECLREMVNKMVYVNENNHAFKLIRLKGEELLPKEEEDIKVLLNEYFVECIEKLEKSGVDFDNLEDKTLEAYMSDRMIFSKALRGKYPVLEVYKMTEKNEFLYAKPNNSHYNTWGGINSGDGDSPEGSGGQTLSINTFIIMMLMNYRKKTVGNENPWTVLMLDNPFGNASGSHVLDPVFKIANKLNFQIIAFAAPEIIKTEISERFPIFWALQINEEEEKGKLGSVIGRVVHGGRVRS
ncbi:hypothetical protein [Clostridium sp.]|uniref:hypothetical protein n=1 Tax=Clostridium sp. TaxID=1506 RepID=UPI003D6C7D63